MSKVEVDQVTQQSGTTLTVGGGACKTAVVDATTVTLGRCGGTVSLASGATQSGFGRTGTVDWDTTIHTSTVTATKFIPTNGIVAKVENTRNSLENGLTQSAITPYIIKIMVNIPANVFGLIPDEYMAPLDIVNSKL